MRRAASLCYASAGLIVGACLSTSTPERIEPGFTTAGSETGGVQFGGGPAQDAGVSGSAGAGGVPGTGAQNTGGSTSDAGAGGEPPISVDPDKRAIVSVDGRVVSSTNGFGIDGSWGAFVAPTATLTPDFTGLQVCVKGNLPKVPDSTKWTSYWGGGIGLTLRSDGKGGALPYDATAHKVRGFEMTITGAQIPHEIRLKYKAVGSLDNYCSAFFNVKSGDRVQVLVEDVTRDCWNPGGPHVSAKALERFELHVWPELAGDIQMDLCLTDIAVIPSEEGAGGAGGAGAGGEAGAFGLGGASGVN